MGIVAGTKPDLRIILCPCSAATHAEVNAINSVRDKSLLSQSTIYVNLEPCSHFGKTPPCADLIIASKIPKVVVAVRDPYSQVAGRGIARLREAGVEVVEGILADRAVELNRRFFTFHVAFLPSPSPGRSNFPGSSIFIHSQKNSFGSVPYTYSSVEYRLSH